MIIAAAALMALALFFVSNTVVNVVARPGVTAERLNSIASAGRRDALDADDGTTVGDRVVRPIMAWLAEGLMSLLPGRAASHFDDQLVRAGNPVSASAFGMMLTLMPAAMGCAGVLLMASSGASLGTLLFAGFAGVGFGLAIPIVWLRGRMQRRQHIIQRDMPDAIDLLVVSVEAGLGFEAALARVSEGREGPISIELRHVLGDLSLGLGRRQALQGLAKRTGVTAVRTFVAAILQADHTGMGLGQVLRAQAEHLRIQRRQSAEEAAMKAPLKMLFPLVFLIFPALFVVVLAPAMLTFMETINS